MPAARVPDGCRAEADRAAFGMRVPPVQVTAWRPVGLSVAGAGPGDRIETARVMRSGRSRAPVIAARTAAAVGGLVQVEAGFLRGDVDGGQETDRCPVAADLCGGPREAGGAGRGGEPGV